SDETGRFELADIPSGTFEIRARAKGWADSSPALVTAVPGEHVLDVVLTMRAAGRVEVDVLDENEKPAAGWLLTLESENGGRTRKATCDASGRAVVEGLEPGTWSLSAELPEPDLPEDLGTPREKLEHAREKIDK